MNDSPLPHYDAMVLAIKEMDRRLERDGEAIADPVERLHYYATIASNTDAERKIAEIRLRAERSIKDRQVLARGLAKLSRGVPPSRLTKRELVLVFEEAGAGRGAGVKR